jgi:hypothetical protein
MFRTETRAGELTIVVSLKDKACKHRKTNMRKTGASQQGAGSERAWSHGGER